jgi:hypothetical protein
VLAFQKEDARRISTYLVPRSLLRNVGGGWAVVAVADCRGVKSAQNLEPSFLRCPQGESEGRGSRTRRCGRNTQRALTVTGQLSTSRNSHVSTYFVAESSDDHADCLLRVRFTIFLVKNSDRSSTD